MGQYDGEALDPQGLGVAGTVDLNNHGLAVS
ncbi:MAG: hypothetical protein ACI9SB_000709 [Candidatus Azotimanducaceae bacterium]|jgi:hypothetical protein